VNVLNKTRWYIFLFHILFINNPAQAQNVYDMSALDLRSLCILADEHSSNLITVHKELTRRGAKGACSGIRAPKDYQHLDRAAYLTQSALDRKLVSYDQDFEKLSSVNLCSAYFSFLETPDQLMGELIERKLSPNICEQIIETYLQRTCAAFIDEIDNPSFADLRRYRQTNEDLEVELASNGFSKKDCNTISSNKTSSLPAEAEPIEEVYNIDLLRITTISMEDVRCASGANQTLILEGKIGPDSSFAMNRLLEDMESCRDAEGTLVKQVEVHLSSGGGFLRDGYELGRTLKKYNVRAVIKDEKVCASSCAVAFLGGADRSIEDKGKIMFHAPYFSGKNEYGRQDIDCDVGEEALAELNDYYISMTDKETGERLFERTMWYCSADDGWVVTGGAAAELYGIATER
jgi:ATP-dependent protease ClpP protease subunit